MGLMMGCARKSVRIGRTEAFLCSGVREMIELSKFSTALLGPSIVGKLDMMVVGS